MKNIFLLVLLVGVGYFGWNEVSKSKPDWFLKFVANTPIFDTAVSINFNAHKNWTEQSLQSEFENLFLVCANEQSKLGDRVCWTYISKFNDMPANAIAFFFKKNKYGYLRVSSNIENHNRIKDYLDNTYKYLRVSQGSKERFGQELGVWDSPTGFISTFMSKPLKGNDTLLTWLKR